MRVLLPLALLAIASGTLGFLLYGKFAGREEPHDDGFLPLRPAPQAAEFAPDFVLPDLEGRLRSSEEWDQAVRVVNFWATWCPPCIREIPILIDIQRDYAERGIQVLGIAIDDTEAVIEFAADMEFNYPVLVGQDDAVDVGNRFFDGFIGLPFTAFVDRDGRVLRVHLGEIHRDEIEAILAEAL